MADVPAPSYVDPDGGMVIVPKPHCKCGWEWPESAEPWSGQPCSGGRCSEYFCASCGAMQWSTGPVFCRCQYPRSWWFWQPVDVVTTSLLVALVRVVRLFRRRSAA